jgi:DNA-binding transcriptional MerR regulator
VRSKMYVGIVRDAGYTIRSMAERCGLTAHTLRYYERVGLIQPVGRARNGHRRYSEADDAWIHFLHCMRATSMPIRDMQRYAALRELGDSTSLERRKILEDHQAEIAEQIVALQQAHALLTHKIANYRKIEQRIRIGGPNVVEPESAAEPEMDGELASAN